VESADSEVHGDFCALTPSRNISQILRIAPLLKYSGLASTKPELYACSTFSVPVTYSNVADSAILFVVVQVIELIVRPQPDGGNGMLSRNLRNLPRFAYHGCPHVSPQWESAAMLQMLMGGGTVPQTGQHCA
jgi:hypothetical protein